MYSIKQKYTDNPNLVTLVRGETVGLNGEVRVTIRPTKTNPGFERVIRKATQADLKELFEAGNPIIERVERKVEQQVERVESIPETGGEPVEEPKPEKRKKEKQDG